jgi:uncharacterized protein DUF433
MCRVYHQRHLPTRRQHAGPNALPADSRDPDILGGTPVFRGTRVPLQTLFDYLEGGDTLQDFLEGPKGTDGTFPVKLS